MNTILALETSTVRGSVALLRGPEVLFEREFVADRSHNSLLFEPLEAALATAIPSLIVVGTGPGSYSGVRVGLAAGIGLSLGKQIPLIGWPSLCAAEIPLRCQVVGDARRGAFFLAEMENGKLLAGPDLLSLEELNRRMKPPAFTFDEAPFPLSGAEKTIPSARLLARAVAQLTDAELSEASASIPEPIYLRAPFTTTPRQGR
ncbi:MAG: tRNA (adenosine(37)-N6)-threonylcarbamoyltransferase complex dimerization subunit type 1 TsaB [Verrucomicrobiales bacterium]